MKILLALLLLSGCMPNSTKVKNNQPNYQGGTNYPRVQCQMIWESECGLTYTQCFNGLEYYCVRN